MKCELKAGASIDVLSPKEHKEQTDRLLEELKRAARGPLVDLTSAIVATDAAGALGGGLTGPGIVVYTCPMGRTARLHRFSITTDAATPSAPVAAGWLSIYRNQPGPTALVHAFPQPGSATLLPIVQTWGGETAPVFRSGDRIMLAGAALPVSTKIGVTLQLCLYELPDAAGRGA